MELDGLINEAEKERTPLARHAVTAVASPWWLPSCGQLDKGDPRCQRQFICAD
jgi:hypothetical protein